MVFPYWYIHNDHVVRISEHYVGIQTSRHRRRNGKHVSHLQIHTYLHTYTYIQTYILYIYTYIYTLHTFLQRKLVSHYDNVFINTRIYARIHTTWRKYTRSNIPHYLPGSRSGYRLGHQKVIDGIINDGLWDLYNDQHMGTVNIHKVHSYIHAYIYINPKLYRTPVNVFTHTCIHTYIAQVTVVNIARKHTAYPVRNRTRSRCVATHSPQPPLRLGLLSPVVIKTFCNDILGTQANIFAAEISPISISTGKG